MVNNAEFVALLDSKLQDLRKERDRLKPIVEQYEILAAQIEIVQRTRNAFAHGVNGIPSFPIIPDEIRERPGQKADLGAIVMGIIRDCGKIHVDELVQKVGAKGVSVSKNAIVGVLGRGLQLKQLERTPDNFYQIKEDRTGAR